MAGRVLLVASVGGHLEELHALQGSLLSGGTSVAWVTFDSPQSRSLLADEPDVSFIRRVGSRGYLDLARNFWPAVRTLLRIRPDAVYSTGAGIALAYLPLACLAGARAGYIESAARTSGASITGRLLRLLPWVALRTQYPRWAGRRWKYAGSVFDGYSPRAAEPQPIRRVLVTLGTQEGFPFRSLVRRMQQIVPDGVEILWQIGPGFPPDERPAGARDLISREELASWIAQCDVVVTHAGVGSALNLLRAGRMPVLVPRSAARGEHIDDHQQLIADELAGRGLAVTAAPDALEWADLVRAAATAIESATVSEVRPALV